MPASTSRKSGGSKKIGRNTAWCKRYRDTAQREVNQRKRYARMAKRGVASHGSADNPQHKAVPVDHAEEALQFYTRKTREAGGGSYFRAFLGKNLYGTIWARSKWDAFRFMEKQFRSEVEYRARRGMPELRDFRVEPLA